MTGHSPSDAQAPNAQRRFPYDLEPQDPALVLTVTLAALTSTGAPWDARGSQSPVLSAICVVGSSAPMLEATSERMVILYRMDFA